MKLFHGTSGFSYKEWKGPFYPQDLPASRMLEYYASRLPAVEINNTFYRLPKAEMLAKWRDAVPESFRFVLKVSQRITHKHRLEGAEDAVRYLLESSTALGSRRGPFLVQLPPYFRKDVGRLERFLAGWPADASAAFEFRHASWFDDEVYAVLRAAGAALCVADTAKGGSDKDETDEDDQDGGESDPAIVATSSWGYLRLRREDYDAAALEAWARRVHAQEWGEAYVFFKHEDEGAGPRLAARFAEAFERVA
ncbi:MAG TPA: DUF72 domain-containing protein [Thermoanaerobaculia bacterium]|nr:DUF72 domain-containing protein [Thermoanaerobaculia bacterium]